MASSKLLPEAVKAWVVARGCGALRRYNEAMKVREKMMKK
jgi:pentatricopeptide repeat protein